MNLTEDEAKQRWCPFAVVGFGNRMPNAFNRLQITGQEAGGQTVEGGALKIPLGAKCLGSACMAWRFGAREARAYPYRVTMKPGAAAEHYAWDPTGHPGYENATVENAPDEPAVGRCGLAG